MLFFLFIFFKIRDIGVFFGLSLCLCLELLSWPNKSIYVFFLILLPFFVLRCIWYGITMTTFLVPCCILKPSQLESIS
jgi:hypothetical protein